MHQWLVLVCLTYLGTGFADHPAAKPLTEGWDYAAPMKKIAAHFRGNEGSFFTSAVP